MATDLRRLVRRLLQAIALQQGRRISMSQYQTYSTRAGRTVTKYVLSEQAQEDAGRRRYKTIIETWSLPDVVKALAAELNKDMDGAQGEAIQESTEAGEGTTKDSRPAEERPKHATRRGGVKRGKG